MLTDLIVAAAADAPAILTAQGHASIWETLEARGVDDAKLARLRFILRRTPATAALVSEYVASFEDLTPEGEDFGDEGPWLHALPDDLVQMLARLSAEDLPTVAAAWSSTEEAQADQWDAGDTASLLGELSALAAGAVQQGLRVLLWTCP